MTTSTDIKETQVPLNSVALWPLGQSGFAIKSPGGTVLALDPYLTNSCEAVGVAHGFNFTRMQPPPLTPSELKEISAYLLTHTHSDHLDPETLAGYRAAGGCGPYVAPMETVEKLQELGVSINEIRPIWPNKSHVFGDLTVQATFAIPFGGDDLTHIGYLVKVSDGPCIYFTGDTAYHELLADAVAPHKPDLLVTVINGAFRNMGPAEAAKLTRDLKVSAVIPCHHDLFPDNSLPTALFLTNLKVLGLSDLCIETRNGQRIDFARPSTVTPE